MGFHYATEKKRFEQEWIKLRKEYEAAGMTPEAIQLLYEFDWEFFCSQRTYSNHTQALPSEHIDDDELEHSTLFHKFETSMTTINDMSSANRYAWVDTIENRKLALALQKLSDEDLELLTFLVLEEHTQRELAKKWGYSQKTISARFNRIRDALKKF